MCLFRGLLLPIIFLVFFTSRDIIYVFGQKLGIVA